MTDQKLFLRCKIYGKNARLWRQKFLGLLPEVWKRRLYEKKGYNSIFEFAAKLAGVSQEQVRMVLNLEFRFQDKPALHNLLVNGEASANKLARVASIACSENQEELAEKVQILSQRALDTLVKDERFAYSEKISSRNKSELFQSGFNCSEKAKPDSRENERNSSENQNNQIANFSNQNGLFKPCTDSKALCAQELNPKISSSAQEEKEEYQTLLDDSINQTKADPINSEKPDPQNQTENSNRIININRDLELISHLPNLLKDRLETLVKKGIDIGQLINELLDKHEDKISTEKEQLASETKPTNSRYISVKIKRILRKENGTKCSISNCAKPANTIHHANRFALSHNHNPQYLAPLCHEIAHSIDIKYQQFHAPLFTGAKTSGRRANPFHFNQICSKLPPHLLKKK